VVAISLLSRFLGL